MAKTPSLEDRLRMLREQRRSMTGRDAGMMAERAGDTERFTSRPDPYTTKGQSLTAPEETWRTKLFDAIAGDGSNYDRVQFARKFEGLLDFTTPVLALDDTARAMGDGRYGDAAMAGLGLIPGVAPAGKGAKALKAGSKKAKGLLDEYVVPGYEHLPKYEPPIDDMLDAPRVPRPNRRALDSVDDTPGTDPRYRGAAPDRSGGDYPRYQPREVPERMNRLISAADDPSNPINSMFDRYIEKGKTLGGEDWYNTEETRDWFVDALGEEQGDREWREFMTLIGTTSTGSDVPSNIRNATFYRALKPEDRVAVAARVAEGGITPADAAKELGIDVPNAPDNYRYGHVMQGNHAKNVLNYEKGDWAREVPEGLTQAERTKWLQANPKVKGFGNDLLGNRGNIAADKHFMRMLAMSDGGPDFLTSQAQLSAENLAKLDKHYKGALKPYTKTRKTGTGALVTEVNLQKAYEDGVITDTAPFKGMAQAWLDNPKPTEYAALEAMAQRLAKRYDMTPSQFQAALWMGAGDVTGLADESQGTFQELFRRTLDKRAKERKMTRREMLEDFIRNKSPLAIAPGAGLGGLLATQPSEDEEQRF